MPHALRADILETARALLQRELDRRYPGREPDADEYDAALRAILVECDNLGSDALLMPEVRAALVRLRRQPEPAVQVN